MAKRVTNRELAAIRERALGCCEYCASPADFATQSFSVEHIIPIIRGGQTILENLAYACPGCNGHKYDKIEAPDPASGLLASLYNPRTQQWQDHFRWNEDFTEIVGVSPTGRATVVALHLNRFGVRNMRRALFALGLHPPSHLPN